MRVASADSAMPRGFCPSFSVATTLSVAVSMTETDADPSLETYARCAAAAGKQYVQPASAVVSRSRGKFIVGSERNGFGVELYEGASVNYPTRICMPPYCHGPTTSSCPCTLARDRVGVRCGGCRQFSSFDLQDVKEGPPWMFAQQ